MKKIISLMLATILIVLSFSCTFMVGAADTISASMSDGSAKVGEEVTLDISVSGNVLVGSGGISFLYDKNVLEIVSGEWTIDEAIIEDFNNKDAVFAYADSKTISGNIFTITFKVKDDASMFTKTDVDFSLYLYDENNELVSCDTESGEVSIICTHVDSEEWSHNEESHWKVCTVCNEKTNEGNHTMDIGVVTKAPTTTDTGIKTFTCTVCGYTETETIPNTAHVHAFGTRWFKDAENHWNACDCGEKGNVAVHTWDDGTITKFATDTESGAIEYKCTVCGYTKTVTIQSTSHVHSFGKEWKNDANNHWNVCDCGEKSNVAAHTWDNGTVTKAVTDTENGIMTYTCTVCGYTKTEIIPCPTHEHSFGSEWKNDAENHWHVCDCGEKGSVAVHTWDAGKVTKAATETETGVMTYTCTVCGYTKTETISSIPHEHSFGTEWKFDNASHWHECKCGEKSELAEHSLVWTNNGDKLVGACSCGYSESKAVVKNDKTVTFDLSGSLEDSKIKLASDMFKILSEKLDADSTISDIEFKMGNIVVKYDAKAIKMLGSISNSSDIVLSVFIVEDKNSALNDAQKEALNGLSANSVVISVDLIVNGQKIHSFDGGTAEITSEYTLPEGVKASDLVACRLEEDGSVKEMKTTYKDGKVTFVTDGHSYYAITEKVNKGLSTGWIIVIVVATVAVIGCAVFFVTKSSSKKKAK